MPSVLPPDLNYTMNEYELFCKREHYILAQIQRLYKKRSHTLTIKKEVYKKLNVFQI